MNRIGLALVVVGGALSASCARDMASESIGSAEEAIVYGADDRKETALSPVLGVQKLGASSAALIPSIRLDETQPSHVQLLSTSLAKAFGVCEDEPFAAQPTAALCSGTLVAQDLLLTAGHCVNSSTCSSLRVVFDYAVAEGLLKSLTSSEVYGCREVVARRQEGTLDYAVIRLDRPVSNRAPVPVRLGNEPLNAGQDLFVIGHPSGLPQKVAGGAQVDEPRAQTLDFFTANLDVFPSSSGGGVFDLNSGELVGLVVRGPDAAYASSGGEACKRAVVVPDAWSTPIESTYVQRAIEDLCSTSAVASLCSCGNSACEPALRENTRSCPSDCGSTCGDGACNGAENARDCYVDCGSCGNATCEPEEIARMSCCEDCGCPSGYTCKTDSSNSCLPRLGNVNGDDSLDLTDVQWLKKATMTPMRHFGLPSQADVDCSGTVTSDDATYLSAFVNGSRATLPCEAVTAMALGQNHTCALSNGSVRCWGDNSFAQLGVSERPANASAADSVPVRLGERVVQIAAGSNHTCSVDIVGSVRCWGANGSSQLGHGSRKADLLSPVPLGEPATEVSAGGNFACARLMSGHVRCWGDNQFGQLGVGLQSVNEVGLAPVVALPEKVQKIALGTSHACALLVNGNLYCWGANQFGQLGLGHRLTIGDDELPNSAGSVEAGGLVQEVRANWMQTCAELASGGWRCWGDNTFGQLGYPASMPIGDDEKPASVGLVPLAAGVRDLVLGQVRTCSLSADGTVRCWGMNLNGQLGIPSATGTIPAPPSLPGLPGTPSTLPSALPPIEFGQSVSALYGGGQHSCAVLADGGLSCWGANLLGQLGYGNRLNVGDDETPFAAGGVPVNSEPELGWVFKNAGDFEVWKAEERGHASRTTLSFWVKNNGQRAISDFRLFYSLSGAERPGIPVEVYSELTPRSRVAIMQEKAANLWTLELSFSDFKPSSGSRICGNHNFERISFGFNSHQRGWDSDNDYSASDADPIGGAHRTTRIQIVGPGNDVWYGWSRGQDVF